MKLTETAKMRIRPRDFWLSVISVALVLGVVGIYNIQTGHVPLLGPGFYGGALVIVWAISFSQLLRFGRAAFPWQRVVYLIAFTVFMLSSLTRNPSAAVSWIENISVLVLVAGGLSPFIKFGKQSDVPTGDSGPISAS